MAGAIDDLGTQGVIHVDVAGRLTRAWCTVSLLLVEAQIGAGDRSAYVTYFGGESGRGGSGDGRETSEDGQRVGGAAGSARKPLAMRLTDDQFESLVDVYRILLPFYDAVDAALQGMGLRESEKRRGEAGVTG